MSAWTGALPGARTNSVPIAQTQSRRVLSVRLLVRVQLGTPIWGRSSSAERSFDMREEKRAALFVPTILEGIAQKGERMRHVHQVGGAKPSALTMFVPAV